MGDGKPGKKRPNKHRYVKCSHRGIELYGQNVDRMKDRRLKESLGKHGLFVVEGQNDLMRLDTWASRQSNEKLELIANQASQGKITPLSDNDEEDEAGFKELLWQLASRKLAVKLGWSRESHDDQFVGLTPDIIDFEVPNALLGY